jgi:hypothetical protein
VVCAYKANLTLPLSIELIVPSKELFCQSGILHANLIKMRSAQMLNYYFLANTSTSAEI